jgi:dTMP kinase
MGNLIVIEGSDGAGKETQTNLLQAFFQSTGTVFESVSFPNYQEAYSAPVRMYLSGDFGKKPSDVSAYAASVLFSVDRFASFRTTWKDAYEAGTIILADRYIPSNMIHQAAKIEDPDQRKAFLCWVEDFEYRIMGLPRPRIIFFLDMPPEVSHRLRENRKNKADGSDKKDIHERDEAYMVASYQTACQVAKAYKWIRIQCVEEGRLKSIEEIHQEIIVHLKREQIIEEAME